MRRTLSLTVYLVALLLSAPALAVDTYLGTIASSGSSTTNLTTATVFHLKAKWKVSVQCDAATYVLEGPGETALTVTSSNGLRIEANALFDVDLTDTRNGNSPEQVIGILPVTGSANCKVFVSLP